MKHIFIVNPAAGGEDSTRKIAEAVKTLAAKKNFDYKVWVTERPKHAVEIVHKVMAQNPDETVRFYACGGDGTLNEVAQGVVNYENAQITNLPYGTGNDFVRIFKEDGEFSIENLVDGEVMDIDYIETDKGISLNITTIGLDARIARGMQKYKRIFKKNGQVPYVVAIFENLITPISRNLKIEIDGNDVSGDYVVLLAANGNYYGGGFNPVPDASVTDGKLDVLLIKRLSRFTIARVINAYKNGEYKKYPQYIDYYEAKDIVVKQNDKYIMDLNLDGEVFGVSETKISVSQKKIHFVVPKKHAVHE
ncbi:MAG: diacylglycerol kinase family lipid kinase [Clostridia bacterium]|nr:diacylglycerol kinase family lipid kinase [Clostridia bacterium]